MTAAPLEIHAPVIVPVAPPARRRVIRRRPTQEQGRALEKLSHAIEYLIDSNMLLPEGESSRAAAEAAGMLIRLNQQVFAECVEIVPLRRRVQMWFERHWSGRPVKAFGHGGYGRPTR